MDLLQLERYLALEKIEPTYLVAAANCLLQEYNLSYLSQSYQIVEVELYYYSLQHPDPYVHRHVEQESYLKWYFHRSGESNTYREGNYKGLDLTLGHRGICLSFLIRSLKRLADNSLIEGPCLVVNELMRVAQNNYIIGWQANLASWVTTLQGQTSLGLIKIPSRHLTIYRSPRVGLNPAREGGQSYYSLPYRFISEIKLKKGRHELIKGLLQSGYSMEKIEALLVCRRETILKNLARV